MGLSRPPWAAGTGSVWVEGGRVDLGKRGRARAAASDAGKGAGAWLGGAGGRRASPSIRGPHVHRVC